MKDRMYIPQPYGWVNDLMDQARDQGYARGYASGWEDGHVAGEKKATERFNKFIANLMREGDQDDMAY